MCLLACLRSAARALGQRTTIFGSTDALIDEMGCVWVPEDLALAPTKPESLRPLAERRPVFNANRCPFCLKVEGASELHVANGLGSALGDAVIGMNVVAWLKSQAPSIQVHLHLARNTTPAVFRLLEMARHLISGVHRLPGRVDRAQAQVLDLSGFHDWPMFAAQPMIEVFARAFGVAPDVLPPSHRRNAWLNELSTPVLPEAWVSREFVLLCAEASTPLRSIPRALLPAMVDRIARQYGMPVVGFGPVCHPDYSDVSPWSRDLDEFMAWVQHAQIVVGVDSAGVHLAAGFDVPTLAVFSSIDPALRVADYPSCRSLDIRTTRTSGLEHSTDAQVLREADEAWQAVVCGKDIPWPAPTSPVGNRTPR